MGFCLDKIKNFSLNQFPRNIPHNVELALKGTLMHVGHVGLLIPPLLAWECPGGILNSITPEFIICYAAYQDLYLLFKKLLAVS